jgi:hypothetical protein
LTLKRRFEQIPLPGIGCLWADRPGRGMLTSSFVCRPDSCSGTGVHSPLTPADVRHAKLKPIFPTVLNLTVIHCSLRAGSQSSTLNWQQMSRLCSTPPVIKSRAIGANLHPLDRSALSELGLSFSPEGLSFNPAV